MHIHNSPHTPMLFAERLLEPGDACTKAGLPQGFPVCASWRVADEVFGRVVLMNDFCRQQSRAQGSWRMIEGDECGGNTLNPFALSAPHLTTFILPLQGLTFERRHWKKVAGARHDFVSLEGDRQEHLHTACQTIHGRYDVEFEVRCELPTFQGW